VKFISKSAEETRQIAKDLAQQVIKEEKQTSGALIVGLEGELGAGKTTFAQGFAQGLGIKEPITSPTFVIFKMYAIPKGKHFRRLVHMDCYRLKDKAELAPIGFGEVAGDNTHIILVEWPQRIEGGLAKDRITVHIDHSEETERKIQIR